MTLKKSIPIVFIILASFILFASCSTTPSNPVKQAAGDTSSRPGTQDAGTAAPAGEASAAGKKDPINLNDTGKTVIKLISTSQTYPTNSFLIISKSGTVVAADPFEPAAGVSPDVVTVTHPHPDHMDMNLLDKVKCKKILTKTGSFTVKDVQITGIPASHMGNEINLSSPSNVLYLYEIDGLRIVHMGDIGQDRLTDEQIKALGHVDIAFMQFVNSYSDYSLENEKGFKLIEQIKPTLIIPTHTTPEATAKIGQLVGKLETAENQIAVSTDDLRKSGRKVIDLKNTINGSK